MKAKSCRGRTWGFQHESDFRGRRIQRTYAKMLRDWGRNMRRNVGRPAGREFATRKLLVPLRLWAAATKAVKADRKCLARNNRLRHHARRIGFMSYSLGFTAASLRPELLRAIIEIRAQETSWERTKCRILDENVLQSRSPNSAARMERELRPRIQALTDFQVALFRTSTRDVQTQLAWLAAVKHASLLFEFAATVLREKMEVHDPILRASDWEGFLADQKNSQPQIASFSATTLGKVKRVVLAMLREVGILTAGDAFGHIRRPVLNPELGKVIRLDDSKWLAAFLVPDAEIRESRQRLS